MTADRISIDAQHTGGIAHPASVESKLNNLGFNQRITRLVGVCFNERSATVKAPVTLRAATGGAVAGPPVRFDLLSLTTMFASDCF